MAPVGELFVPFDVVLILVSFARLWRLWHVGHKPFEEAGSDTIMLATPNGNILWTCDPKIAKLLYSTPSVQTPVNILNFLDVWGPSISTVEGTEWKIHRKVITQGFNTSTYSMVWKEAIHQTNGLIVCWKEANTGDSIPIVNHWTSRLVLHVLSSVLFNRKLDWQSSRENAIGKCQSNDQSNFETALFTVLARIGLIFVIPRALLRLPIQDFRRVRGALADLTSHMQNMISTALQKSHELKVKPTKSLVESIVLAGMPEHIDSSYQLSTLTKESVLGNIFVTLMAGHETSGNTLAFIILLLSIYPEYQGEIQADLDRVLGSRLQNEWNSEIDYPALQKGILGAVVKEVLRLYCVIEFGFRKTVTSTKVTDTSGKEYIIPTNTVCMVDFSAAFQNPAVWSQTNTSKKRRKELHYSHAIDFDPKRWLGDIDQANTDSYWPFGMGYRKCPGKHFAQIQIIAVLATIFKRNSMELVVDKETLQECGGSQIDAWKRVRDNAIRKLEDGVKVNLNLYMTEVLPIRLVPRA